MITFPTLEVHAAWYAAEQGDSLAQTLRFVRAFVRQLRTEAAPLSVEDFYPYVAGKRREFARG